MYAQTYPKDVDREIEENGGADGRSVGERYPGLVRIE
jgi:hypothetical protein